MEGINWVEVIAGHYEGRTGKIVEAGSFNVFGKQVEGIRVEVPGLAGPLVLSHGEYKAAEAPVHNPTFDRFKRGRI